MIITELLAENFRKYDVLHLESLPGKGLIAINGGNESGKSTIGDAICFTLFGRTDQLGEHAVAKLVRWGEEEAKVTLSFRQKEKHYRLTRTADSNGGQSASLWCVEDDKVLADTTEDVAAALKQLLGYGYPAFAKTFYWSQQTSDDSRTDTESLQAMAGVKTYIKLDEVLRTEQEKMSGELEQIEQDYQASVAERDATKVDQNWLPELVDIREVLDNRHQDSLALGKKINLVRESYTGKHGEYHLFERRNSLIGRLTTLGIILLVLLLLGWALLTFAPDLLALDNSAGLGRGLLWSGVAVAIITSLLMFYGWHLESSKINPLLEDASAMSDDLMQGTAQLNDSAEMLLGSSAYAYLDREKLLKDDDEVRDWQSDPVHLQDMAERMRDYRADPLEAVAAADGVSMALDKRSDMLERCSFRAEADEIKERKRVDEYMELHTEVLRHGKIRAEHKHQINVRRKALQLIHKASQHSIRSFNRIVHERCRTLLSDFTQSHYKDLEIDTDFTLKVLSEEKGGYLEMEEISAGTQRQIALAMRVSLANTLAESTDADGQFMFLDEPFAFFDPERTTATINRLYESTDGNLSQIWVIVQGMPQGLDAAFMINCRMDSDELTVSG